MNIQPDVKNARGKDLVMFGGAGIAATFMGLDLIEEYRLMVTPTLLGVGIPLFKGGYHRARLKTGEVATVGHGCSAVVVPRADDNGQSKVFANGGGTHGG